MGKRGRVGDISGAEHRNSLPGAWLVTRAAVTLWTTWDIRRSQVTEPLGDLCLSSAPPKAVHLVSRSPSAHPNGVFA